MSDTKTEPFHYETLAAFRASLRRFLRFSEEAARVAGLTPQKHQALLAIKGFSADGEMTIRELAESLQIRQHSASDLAKRLEADGLIRRHADAHDHRKVHLSLTARGVKNLERLSATHWQELEQIEPELRAILKALKKSSGESR